MVNCMWIKKVQICNAHVSFVTVKSKIRHVYVLVGTGLQVGIFGTVQGLYPRHKKVHIVNVSWTEYWLSKYDTGCRYPSI